MAGGSVSCYFQRRVKQHVLKSPKIYILWDQAIKLLEIYPERVLLMDVLKDAVFFHCVFWET